MESKGKDGGVPGRKGLWQENGIIIITIITTTITTTITTRRTITTIIIITPWSRVFLEKLTNFQLVKKLAAFYGTRRFITAFTSASHLSLSWASSIKSILPHPTSWRSFSILSFHLCLGLPSGLFPSGSPTKTLYTPLPFPYTLHARPISFFPILLFK